METQLLKLSVSHRIELIISDNHFNSFLFNELIKHSVKEIYALIDLFYLFASIASR